MFQGVFTAIATPFSPPPSNVPTHQVTPALTPLDETALRALVESQIAAGVDGLVPCGTTGESPTLTLAEHARVVEIVVETARGRVPIIAGVGSNATHHSVELAKIAREKRADGVLAVVPYYNKPTQSGMELHFRAIAEGGSLPVVLYNVPGRTISDLLPDTIVRLAEIGAIVAIKEATGSIPRAQQILARAPRLRVLSGDDATAYALYACGAHGVISVVSNVAPKAMADMWDFAAAGNWSEARKISDDLQPLIDALFVEANPIPVKAAMALQQQLSSVLRLPLTSAVPSTVERLRPLLDKLDAQQRSRSETR